MIEDTGHDPRNHVGRHLPFQPRFDPFHGFVAERFIELPLKPGDEITALTQHHGDLWATTRYGEMYRIRSDQ